MDTWKDVKDASTRNVYICHGFSMTEGKFIPNSEHLGSNTLVLDKMERNDLSTKEVKDYLILTKVGTAEKGEVIGNLKKFILP